MAAANCSGLSCLSPASACNSRAASLAGIKGLPSPMPVSIAFRIRLSCSMASFVVTKSTARSWRCDCPRTSWPFSVSCSMRFSTPACVTPLSPRSTAVLTTSEVLNAASRSLSIRMALAVAYWVRTTLGVRVSRDNPWSISGSSPRRKCSPIFWIVSRIAAPTAITPRSVVPFSQARRAALNMLSPL